MKKILLAVTAALAITSCSQNEEFENEGQKTEINFTTIVSKATRASELKTEGLKTNGGFKVFAYNTKDNDMSAETILGEKFHIIFRITKVIMFLKKSCRICVVDIACHNIKRYIYSCLICHVHQIAKQLLK